MSAEPGDEVTVSLSTPASAAPSTKPAPEPLAPSAEKPKAIVPEDEPKAKVKPDDDDDNKKDKAADNEPLPPLQAPKKDKQQHKEPLMELVDDLQAFVSETNDEIENYIAQKGKQGWNAFKETGPGQEVDKALDSAKAGIGQVRDAMNDRMDLGKQAIAKSVSDSFASLKDKVSNAFSKAKEIPDLPQAQNATVKEDVAVKEDASVKEDATAAVEVEVSLSAPEDSAPSQANDWIAEFDDMDVGGLVADNEAQPKAAVPDPAPEAASPAENAPEAEEPQRNVPGS